MVSQRGAKTILTLSAQADLSSRCRDTQHRSVHSHKYLPRRGLTLEWQRDLFLHVFISSSQKCLDWRPDQGIAGGPRYLQTVQDITRAWAQQNLPAAPSSHHYSGLAHRGPDGGVYC